MPDKILKFRGNESSHEAIGIAMGAVSVCWDNIEGAGVFQDDRAAAIMDELTEYLQQRIISKVRNYSGSRKVAVVECPHLTGLCWITEDGMLAQLPCPCNDRSVIKEVFLLRDKLPVDADPAAVEEWLASD